MWGNALRKQYMNCFCSREVSVRGQYMQIRYGQVFCFFFYTKFLYSSGWAESAGIFTVSKRPNQGRCPESSQTGFR